MAPKKGIFLVIFLYLFSQAFGFNLSPGDEAQIKAVIQRWSDLQVEACRNGGDVSQFSEVLINTRDFSLDDEQKAFAARVLGADALQGGGFLTAMQAEHRSKGEGWALLKKAIHKAQQENREITHEEMDEIVKKNHGVLPGVLLETAQKAQLTFESIRQTIGSRVIVRIYDGVRLVKYTLVKVGVKWLISSAKTLRNDF